MLALHYTQHNRLSTTMQSPLRTDVRYEPTCTYYSPFDKVRITHQQSKHKWRLMEFHDRLQQLVLEAHAWLDSYTNTIAYQHTLVQFIEAHPELGDSYLSRDNHVYSMTPLNTSGVQMTMISRTVKALDRIYAEMFHSSPYELLHHMSNPDTYIKFMRTIRMHHKTVHTNLFELTTTLSGNSQVSYVNRVFTRNNIWYQQPRRAMTTRVRITIDGVDVLRRNMPRCSLAMRSSTDTDTTASDRQSTPHHQTSKPVSMIIAAAASTPTDAMIQLQQLVNLRTEEINKINKHYGRCIHLWKSTTMRSISQCLHDLRLFINLAFNR